MKRLLVIALCVLICCQGCRMTATPVETERKFTLYVGADAYEVYFSSIAASADFEEQMLNNPLDKNTDIYSFDDLRFGNIPSYYEYYEKWNYEIVNALSILKEITSDDEYSHIMQSQAAWAQYVDFSFDLEHDMYSVDGVVPNGMFYPTVFWLCGVRARARAMELYGYEYLLTGKVSFLESAHADVPSNTLQGEKTDLTISILPLTYEFYSQIDALLTESFSEGKADLGEEYYKLCADADELITELTAELSDDLEKNLCTAEESWRAYIEETYQAEKAILKRSKGEVHSATLVRWERSLSRLAELYSYKEGLNQYH